MVLTADVRALSCFFLGLFVLAFGLYSRILKESLYLSEPLLSTLLGVLLSPKGLNFLHFFPQDWDQNLRHDAARETLAWFCRVVIGIQVLFAASTLPSRWLLRGDSIRSMAVMLGPVMTTGWLVSSAIVRVALPSTTWTEALTIGACVAPTDPVLANSVVKGIYAEHHIPRHVRELLIAESGLNDGFGTPFLFVPILSILHDFTPFPTIRAFLLDILLRDVLLGSSLGIALGYIARKCLKIARQQETIDRESILVFSVALALLTIGTGEIIGTNGLLACFFAGTSLNWTDRIRAEDLHSHFSEGIELFFDSAVFLVLGTILPFDTWSDTKFLPLPNLILAGVLMLLFRRLPAVLAFYKITPLLKTQKEAVFTGYFGPIGISALYYALMATDRLPDDFVARNKIISATTFIIFCSVLVHGASPPLIMLVSNIPGSLEGRPGGVEISDEGGSPGERDPLLGNGISGEDGGSIGQRIPAIRHERRVYSAMSPSVEAPPRAADDEVGGHRGTRSEVGME